MTTASGHYSADRYADFQKAVDAFKVASTAALPRIKAKVKHDAETKYGTHAVAAGTCAASAFLAALESATDMLEEGELLSLATEGDVTETAFMNGDTVLFTMSANGLYTHLPDVNEGCLALYGVCSDQGNSGIVWSIPRFFQVITCTD